MNKYNPTYEECMGCSAERCRGGTFMDIRLANGNEAMLCEDCATAALLKAANSPLSLVRLRVERVAVMVLQAVLPGGAA